MKNIINIFKRSKQLKLPGILSDIDGVVYRGGQAIPGSEEVIRSIY